jgi:F-type H+-transporting ATPase subunit gamma
MLRRPTALRRDVALCARARSAILLAELAEEYVFAELCEALTLSLAAENEARMRAMAAAKSNVSKMLDELIARVRQLRQEEITNEIIELGGRKASAGHWN